MFLATLVALHFTPVSESVSGSAEFRTSVASRLASLFGTEPHVHETFQRENDDDYDDVHGS